MKRTLFFLLEKLEIKRSERIAISVLLILLVGLSGMLTFQEPYANYNEEAYAQLERLFREKSEQIEKDRDLILARYEPGREAPVSMKQEEDLQLTFPDTTNDDPRNVESSEVININTATNERLQELPGVGPTYAARIISWREENGSFTSKDQLLEIKGIGEKRLARIKPLVTLE